MNDNEIGADVFHLIGASGTDQLQFVQSDTPDAIEARMFAILNRINTDFLRLGREIYKVFWRRTYLEWDYNTFYDCMSDKFHLSRERARRTLLIWTKFVKELGIDPDEMIGVPFHKAYTMLNLVDEKNVHGLIKKAQTTKAAEFRSHISLLRGKPKAVDMAKESAQVVEETVTEHNASTSSSGRLSLAVQPEVVDSDRPTKVTYNLYPSQREIIDAAIQEVQREKTGGGTMAPNEALSHVALGFLADRLTRDDRPNAQVRFYLAWFERVYGGKFVWITSDEAAKVLTDAIHQNPDLFPEQGKTTVMKEVPNERPDD